MFEKLRKPFLLVLCLVVLAVSCISFAYSSADSLELTPAPTSQYTTLVGTLNVIKTRPDTKSILKFQLNTEKGPFILSGTTAGIEKFDGEIIEVTGNYVNSILDTYPPRFSIVSIKPFGLTKIHTITSYKPYYYADGHTSIEYSSPGGNCTISWRDYSDYAFFNGRVTVGSSTYDIQLVSPTFATVDTITGKFNITKNGFPVATSVPGKVYGLNQNTGSYFKFYSDDTRWHLSAFITYRFDY